LVDYCAFCNAEILEGKDKKAMLQNNMA